MKPIDTNTRLYIEKQFFKRHIIFKLEILAEFLRFENEFLLQKKGDDCQRNYSANYIPDKQWQFVRSFLMVNYNT